MANTVPDQTKYIPSYVLVTAIGIVIGDFRDALPHMIHAHACSTIHAHALATCR
jgi:hypothetical protein